MFHLSKKIRLKFLLDENIDVRLASYLKNQGFSVSFSPKGIDDQSVIELAQKEKRIFISNDVDFTDTLLYPPKMFFGIIIFRIHPPRLDKLITSLTQLLTKLPSKTIKGKSFLLHENGYILID